jgi:hypothetical protein
MVGTVDWISAVWVLWEIAYIVYAAAWEGRTVTTPEWISFGVGLMFAFLILLAEFRTRGAADRELAAEKFARLQEHGELKTELARSFAYNQGAFQSVGRQFDVLALTRPELRADFDKIKEQIEPRQPALIYDGFDDTPYTWRSNGQSYQYVHLKFRNEPTGVRASEAAAKLSWWDSEQRLLFSVDGKWEKAEKGRPIDFSPNNASHGLDLFIYHEPEEDWCFGLSDVNQPIDEKYRLRSGSYKVKVTISCEGYTEDFWFKVVTIPTPDVEPLSRKGNYD